MHKVPHKKPSTIKYLPEIGGSIWLSFYAYLKFRAVDLGLSEYSVDPYTFLFLDTITIPSYVICSGQLIRRLWCKTVSLPTLVWASGALSSFLLPYLYLAFAGKEKFPQPVWILLVTFVATALLVSFYSLQQQTQAVTGQFESDKKSAS